MIYSYWELKNWFTDVDFCVVGSGIVGLNAALNLRHRFPEIKILILEKGTLPQGASTKNAGFACFGSLSEINDDLNHHAPQDVIDLIKKRWAGLQVLRNTLGDQTINFQSYGGYELFLQKDDVMFESCVDKLPGINDLLQPIFNQDVFSLQKNCSSFGKIKDTIIFNKLEAQIDTGAMMQALLKRAISKDILILNHQVVTDFHEFENGVQVAIGDHTFNVGKLLFATNGFAGQLTNNEVKPARAQVLITEPIPNLAIKGTYHLDKGFYYFRNIDNRILLGGGRNLDFNGETTTELGQTEIIQNNLEQLLKEVILPRQDFKIAHRWSGIMGIGTQKNPIVKQLSNHVYCGVRLGGMGVAIGSLIGKELADLV